MYDWSINPRVQFAAKQMKLGGIVAYPTEAMWGLGCNPYDEVAVNRLLELKNRSAAKGVILIAAHIDMFAHILLDLNDIQRQKLKNSWLGSGVSPVTWLVPKNEWVPDWISGDSDRVALRVTNHPVAAGLSRAYGAPLVSTSCNPQGAVPARTIDQVRRYFNDQLDAITCGTVGRRASPSEIRDLVTGEIIRAG